MLEYLTKLEINKNLRINYSKEFLDKENTDFITMPLENFLQKYYSKLDAFDEEVWEKTLLNLVKLAYDEKTFNKMVENFGYSSIEKHDFKKQFDFFDELKNDNRLDIDTQKFIGFMAGNHFFDKYVFSIKDWFNSYYWANPYLSLTNSTEKANFTINHILSSPYGLNYLKSVLPRLNHWRR